MSDFVIMHGSQTRKTLGRDCDILQAIAFDALKPLSPYQIAERAQESLREKASAGARGGWGWRVGVHDRE